MKFDATKVVTTICQQSGREIFYQTASGTAEDSDFRYLSADEVDAFKAYRAANPEREYVVINAPGE